MRDEFDRPVTEAVQTSVLAAVHRVQDAIERESANVDPHWRSQVALIVATYTFYKYAYESGQPLDVVIRKCCENVRGSGLL